MNKQITSLFVNFDEREMKQEPQGFVEEEEENLEDVEEEEAQPKKKVKFIRKRNKVGIKYLAPQ